MKLTPEMLAGAMMAFGALMIILAALGKGVG